MVRDHEASVLLHLAHLVAQARAPEEIRVALASAGVEIVRANAAVVLEVGPDGSLRVAATRDAPQTLSGWTAEAETIGPELGALLLTEAGKDFSGVHVEPLVSTGSLFGAMALLFREREPTAHDLELAHGLVDLAATGMAKQAQVQALSVAHAELRASQEALLRTEKLRALGQMAAGITHDFKNILNPLSLHLQLIQRALSKGDTENAQKGVEEARAILTRGVETVERMREFSRQTPETKLETVDPNFLVHEARDLAKPRMASRGGRMNAIKEELGEPPAILARSGEVVSALVNLIVNAIDAMPGGGAITLRTRKEREGALIEVADEGPGMPPDVQARIFEPFFTTKGEAGTGLGLAMVYACVQRHGGSIGLETVPGKGTTFTLWFPRGR